jgi:hypothetical protein
MSYVIAIDPGLTGGMCLYNLTSNKIIEVLNTPTYKKDKKSYLCSKNILVKLREWKLKTNNVVIEVQTVMKRDGGKSTITTLRNYGFLLGLLESLELDIIEVAPTTWQAVMLKDVIDPGEPIKMKPTKRKAMMLTKKFHPKNDGQADAICIAMYYKTTLNQV